MAHRPELLILDEPTSGLDPVVRRELLAELLDFMGDGERSVLFSTHITSDLDRVADYITIIVDGRIHDSDEKDALLEKARKDEPTASIEDIVIWQREGGKSEMTNLIWKDLYVNRSMILIAIGLFGGSSFLERSQAPKRLPRTA